MARQRATEYRDRAAQARRIADNMHDCQAQVELRDMADALDDEAEKLESDEAANPIPPPMKDA